MGAEALFSGLAGALLVFFLTSVRSWAAERSQRKRELKGLLKLIDMEIYQNRYKLEIIKSNPDVGQSYSTYSQLHLETWDSSKARLAQLLDSEHLETLNRHYGLLQRLTVILPDNPFNPSRGLSRGAKRNSKVKRAIGQATEDATPKRETLLSVYARDALKYGDDARQYAKAHIGPPPDYFELYTEEQEGLLSSNADGS